MTITNYVFGNTPSLVPLAEGSDGWSDDLARACGEDPEDEELVLTKLNAAWNGHPAGAFVLCGCTVSGHPFHVIEGWDPD